MKRKGYLILGFLLLLGAVFMVIEMCSSEGKSVVDSIRLEQPETKIEFEQTQWQKKTKEGYPFRAQMLDDVVYNKEIRSLNKKEILETLGLPERESNNHLYYLIAQRKIGSWPINTRTLVVKFTDQDSIEWMKIHE